jgi:hypothetical protein
LRAKKVRRAIRKSARLVGGDLPVQAELLPSLAALMAIAIAVAEDARRQPSGDEALDLEVGDVLARAQRVPTGKGKPVSRNDRGRYPRRGNVFEDGDRA